MTPKEKAKELVDKLYAYSAGVGTNNAKQCALICVAEKISTYRMLFPLLEMDCEIEDSSYYKELEEVKQELLKQQI